jgi:hypothetical protein
LTPEGKSRRVFFDAGEKKKRAFDNFWMPRPKEPDGTLIFKGWGLMSLLFVLTDIFSDVAGKLEGETIIDDYMLIKPTTRFLHHTVHMSPASRYPLVKRPKPTRDWKAPIRDLLKGAFTHTHLRILGKHPQDAR